MKDDDIELEEPEDIESDKSEFNKIIQTVVVPKNERMFLDCFSLTEFVNVITTRATQIRNGYPSYVEPKISEIQTALMELFAKKCPLTIVRPRIDFTGYNFKIREVEHWEANELFIPEKCISNDKELIDFKDTLNLEKFILNYSKNSENSENSKNSENSENSKNSKNQEDF